MFITLNFADGDGDIGSDEQDNLWIRDGRNDELVASYRIPNHSPAAEGELRKGQLKLIVYSSCCIYADGQFCVSRPQDPLQEMSYRIQVRDKAGNYSEIIETATLRLDCQ